MVGISRTLLRQTAETTRRYDQGWVDRLRVYVRGGTGGNGLPRVGGLGGGGGSVIVKSSEEVKNLKQVQQLDTRKRFIAGDGGHARPVRLLGEAGTDVEIAVPVGVTVLTDEGVVLGDLCRQGQEVVVARGGMGGIAGTNFLGTPGERRSIRLDLKLIGDVGFVGFPNAGKSTLLKAISRARPKIASYPFTTIRPNVGICEFDDLRRISFADLPGLIEGAHLNVGMGHAFLKHVERTKVLMFVIDINGFQFKSTTPLRSALETILILTRELELYKEDLLDKPAVCVISKMDSKGAERAYETLKGQLENIDEIVSDEKVISNELRPTKFFKFSDIIPISAKFSPKSVEYLKFRIRHVIDEDEQRKNEYLKTELEQKVTRKLSEKSLIA